MKHILLLSCLLFLTQCATNNVGSNKPLDNNSAGQVLNERVYEVDGVRKRDRRIVVSTSPRLETRLITEILP